MIWNDNTTNTGRQKFYTNQKFKPNEWDALWIYSVCCVWCWECIVGVLDNSKGPSPDDVPPLILKNCASTLTLPLCLLLVVLVCFSCQVRDVVTYQTTVELRFFFKLLFWLMKESKLVNCGASQLENFWCLWNIHSGFYQELVQLKMFM
jgi:hypothetical protein